MEKKLHQQKPKVSELGKNGLTHLKLTNEQQKIISSKGDIKINAVAGSGKTTTIIEYARSRPADSKILYLAFNKAVKLQALERFEKLNLRNVKVETAHSLAYRAIVYQYDYSVKSQSYSTHEIVELLKLKNSGEKHLEFILANHIAKFAAYFCNSAKPKVKELNYLEVLTDNKSREFVKAHYEEIEKQTRQLLAKMDKGQIEITHDFYLKKYQLSEPKLNYDYILFDEGQDASPVMLDIFFKQKACKVIVGDTHQQIYGWRHAVNSLEQSNFKTYQLSQSFRFGQPIADLAIQVLDWKNNLGEETNVLISGNSSGQPTTKEATKQLAKPSTKKTSKAILGRTNLSLLLKAIEYVSDDSLNKKKIYFEGNINSYSYAADGASLYDVLNLYNGDHKKISNKLLKQMKSVKEMQDYIDFTEDVQFSMMLEIVKKHGNSLPRILKTMKEKHVSDADKSQADVVFSTVHRCKGMEYDTVELLNDFMTEERLRKSLYDDKFSSARLNEEINLLYVAITRAKNKVLIPESMLPESFKSTDSYNSNTISVLKATPKASPKGIYDEWDNSPPIKIKNYPANNLTGKPKRTTIKSLSPKTKI